MKQLVLGLLLASVGALMVPVGASGATFDMFVGCEQSLEPEHSHKCLTTDHMTAYFKGSEDTNYEACVYPVNPSGPLGAHFEEVGIEFECTPEIEAEAGILYPSSLVIDAPGAYVVVWYVAGTSNELSEWEFTVESPPAPPPPPVVPVAAPAPPPVNTACIAANARVKSLKARVKKAHGTQKAKLKAKLKKAHAAANAAC